MTPIEILTAAKAIIDHPLKWTVGAYARDGADREVSINSPDACKFCLMGAVVKATGHSYNPADNEKDPFAIARKALREVTGYPALGQFNDALGREHGEIIDAFDKAIESLKGK